MLKFSHRTLVLISGAIWLCVGLFLLPLGVNFLITSVQGPLNLDLSPFPLLSRLAPNWMDPEQAVVFLAALGLLIGYFKGKYVLGKSAMKGVERILSFSSPTSLINMYSKKYFLLLGSMFALGFLIKFFGVPADVRGFIDVAIGSALINGATVYFRQAIGYKKEIYL